mmetsp:Transcript_72503/g.222007  ORF Transcript_72503/g.222007 Transcript_72503/m.222007 type:complete len:228 (-) Transcript_72503:20-703(-)
MPLRRLARGGSGGRRARGVGRAPPGGARLRGPRGRRPVRRRAVLGLVRSELAPRRSRQYGYCGFFDGGGGLLANWCLGPWRTADSAGHPPAARAHSVVCVRIAGLATSGARRHFHRRCRRCLGRRSHRRRGVRRLARPPAPQDWRRWSPELAGILLDQRRARGDQGRGDARPARLAAAAPSEGESGAKVHGGAEREQALPSIADAPHFGPKGTDQRRLGWGRAVRRL